jgi:hypothetical protein
MTPRELAKLPLILGIVDHTHPAAAQLLDDAVVRNGLADLEQNPTSLGLASQSKRQRLVVSERVVVETSPLHSSRSTSFSFEPINEYLQLVKA